jgi:hypothetical protein
MGFGRVVVSALALSLFSGSGFSQVTTGLPPFGSFSGGPFDTVNNANLNVHFGVPIFGRSGRGLSFAETLTYDSSIWTPVSGVWTPVTYWGWGNPPTAVTGVVTYTTVNNSCSPYGKPPASWQNFYSFVYTDSSGTPHAFPIFLTNSNGECETAGPSSVTATASDGSGLTLTAWLVGSNVQTSVTDRSGDVITNDITDTNGNEIIIGTSNNVTHFYDTVSGSSPVLTLAGSGNASSPYSFSYTSPSGVLKNVTVSYNNYYVLLCVNQLRLQWDQRVQQCGPAAGKQYQLTRWDVLLVHLRTDARIFGKGYRPYRLGDATDRGNNQLCLRGRQQRNQLRGRKHRHAGADDAGRHLELRAQRDGHGLDHACDRSSR